MTNRGVRRWHFWTCIPYRSCGYTEPRGVGSKKYALQIVAREIRDLKKKYGWESKIYAPLPKHANSGHIHILVLISQKQLSDFIRETTGR